MCRKLLIAFVVLSCTVAVAIAATDPPTSDACGSCHRDIYRMWRDSAHAEACEDPFFTAVFDEVRQTQDLALQRLCLECHAPMAVVTGDLAMHHSVSREGVSCDYCHSLVEVDLTESGARPRLDVGRVKRGTIAEADSPAHDVAFSELHRTSRVCAPCHEFVASNGLAILTTYSEWAASRAAQRGETCQDCHMSLTEGRVVDPRVERDSSARVNLHEMPGGHSLQQLLKALDVKFRPQRTPDGLNVEVRLANQGAGHAVPTGMPGRRITMLVEVSTSGGKTYREERVYAKSFRGAGGRKIDHVTDYFAEGAVLDADTRIRADETRTEVFGFPVPATDNASISVKLHYEHAPLGPESERVWVTFYSERRFLRRADRE